MKIHRPKSLLPTLFLLFFFFLFSSPFATALESDELLLNDDEFEGVKTPNLDHANPTLSPPTPIRRKPDLSSPSSSSDSKAIQFDLEHAFGDSVFSPAGTFTARLKSWSHGGQTLTKLRFSRNTLTGEERKAFENLLKKDDFYTIRLPSNVLNSAGKEYVVSSVRARCLPKESLDEHFVIHTDGVNILAVNYGSAGSCQYPRLLELEKHALELLIHSLGHHVAPTRDFSDLPTKWSFSSYTVLENGEQAQRTPTFAEELLQAEAGEGEGVKPPERSFLAKYWMYLIPLGMIVMNTVTQAMNMPDEQAAGQPGTRPPGTQAQAVAQRAPNAAVRRR